MYKVDPQHVWIASEESLVLPPTSSLNDVGQELTPAMVTFANGSPSSYDPLLVEQRIPSLILN
jgi:hypothetical protein